LRFYSTRTNFHVLMTQTFVSRLRRAWDEMEVHAVAAAACDGELERVVADLVGPLARHRG
jgi:hypothetical protein